MKPERRSIKQGMALTPREWLAIKWYAKRVGARGLAVLRLVSLNVVVYMWTNRNVKAPQ
jgi:hypothetical protein